jgi:hypothetical protein
MKGRNRNGGVKLRRFATTKLAGFINVADFSQQIHTSDHSITKGKKTALKRIVRLLDTLPEQGI